MRKGVIYKITSPSNKVYIGQTVEFNVRLRKYKSLNCKSQIKIYNSFLKYSFENHKIEIIEECDFLQLNERERYWQEYYDSVCNGLNCRYTKSIDKSGIMSFDSKNKMSLAKKGKKHSEETKLKMSLSHRGIKHTDETKQKLKSRIISKETKNKLRNSNSKIILDLNNGVFYFGCKEVSELYNIKRTTISAMLNGKNKNKTNLIYV